MNRFEAGDIVSLYWVNEGALLENCKLISMPSDTGDLIRVEKAGRIYGVNPNCSNFEMIVKKLEE